MPDTTLLPNADEVVIDSNNRATEQFRSFLLAVAESLDSILDATVVNFTRYASIADANSANPNRKDGDTVMFTGQGLGTWNGSKWVKSSDDTTDIT